jgi:hypothetical protein
MASFTLNLPGVADDTDVGAYPASNWPAHKAKKGEPIGDAAETAQTSGGSVEFTDLDDGDYYAVAEVADGEYRYWSISPGQDQPGGQKGAFEAALQPEDWHVVGTAGEPALENSWAAISGAAAGFYKDALGVVRLRGRLTNGSANETVAFTLPEGYRPSVVLIFAIARPATTGGTSAQAWVGSDGGVVIKTASLPAQHVLDGIAFRAA